MCLQPLTIRNPKKDFNKYIDKPFLVVPCGKCVECQNQKKTAFEIRAYYEYKYALDCGGMVLFYTLTLNNQHLPYFDLPQKFSSKTFRFHHFDRNHIKRLVERLRQQYPELVYLVVSEYGGKTRRPHYHVLFFLPYQVNVLSFLDLVRDSWTHFGKSLGNVFVGSDYGVLNSPSALKYCVKYVCKSDETIDVISRFVSKFQSSIYYDKFKPGDTYFYDSLLKKLTPFVYKSQSFGSHAFLYMENISDKLGNITLPYINQALPLPMYFFRKLYYRLEKSPDGYNRYILNDAGIQRKIDIFKNTIDSKVAKVKSLDTNKMVPRDLQDAIFNYSHLHFDFYKQIYKYLVDNVDLKSLFVYEYVYKDRPCHDAVSFIPKEAISFFFSPFVMPFFDYRFVDDNEHMLFNNLEVFRDFDMYLLIVSLCLIYNKYQLYVERINKSNSLARLKSSYLGKDFTNLQKPKSIFQFSNLFNYVEPTKKTSSASVCPFPA